MILRFDGRRGDVDTSRTRSQTKIAHCGVPKAGRVVKVEQRRIGIETERSIAPGSRCIESRLKSYPAGSWPAGLTIRCEAPRTKAQSNPAFGVKRHPEDGRQVANRRRW